MLKVIISPRDMFWRQMGGHLRRVETCSPGVTWGIGYDHTAWVYTGGWGGAFLKGRTYLMDLKFHKINPTISSIIVIFIRFCHRF